MRHCILYFNPGRDVWLRFWAGGDRFRGLLVGMLIFGWGWIGVLRGEGQVIRQHPDNPRYLEWRGKPVVLVGASEHYGALINGGFDFRRYLDTVSGNDLNVVRVFSGTYFENEGDFSITRNTLAPLAPHQLLVPWARSTSGEAQSGGHLFDLDRWNPAYFERLHEFMGYADQRGVAVEVTLFNSFLTYWQWLIHPLNATNNIQGVGRATFDRVHTLEADAGLLAAQEAFVRKLVVELNRHDHVYYEIINSPRMIPALARWQRRMVELILETEAGLPKKHLIAQNIATVSARAVPVHPAVGIFNFHYAAPPEAVALNADQGRVIADDETGYRGVADATYRTEAWDFMMAGGGIFNHLDYSFAVGMESGTYAYPESQPGGGSAALRRQLGVLKRFMAGLDFVRMRPDGKVVKSGVPDGGSVRALVDPERAIALYLREEALTPPWSARWTGRLVPAVSGRYQLRVLSNDGVRLYLDDRPVIENWSDHPQQEDVVSVELEAGRSYALKVEYFYNAGDGALVVSWERPDGVKEVIPSERFRHRDQVPGLLGEYFHGTQLAVPWAQRTDANLQFLLGVKPPFTVPSRSGGGDLEVELGPGMWRAEWVDPQTARVVGLQTLRGGGVRAFSVPYFEVDVAAKIIRIGP